MRTGLPLNLLFNYWLNSKCVRIQRKSQYNNRLNVSDSLVGIPQ